MPSVVKVETADGPEILQTHISEKRDVGCPLSNQMLLCDEKDFLITGNALR